MFTSYLRARFFASIRGLIRIPSLGTGLAGSTLGFAHAEQATKHHNTTAGASQRATGNDSVYRGATNASDDKSYKHTMSLNAAEAAELCYCTAVPPWWVTVAVPAPRLALPCEERQKAASARDICKPGGIRLPAPYFHLT